MAAEVRLAHLESGERSLSRFVCLAEQQNRLILALLGGTDPGPSLAAVNEAASALGWGLTEIGEGSVPVVLRELVAALDARSRIGVRMALEMCSDDADAALLAKLSDREGDAEVRVTEALVAARALVPEVPADDLAEASRRVSEARGVIRRGDPNTRTVCGACRTGESQCCTSLEARYGR